MKKNYKYLCAIIVKDDKALCCKSKSFTDKWAFPYSETPFIFYDGKEYKRLLGEIVSGDCREDYAFRTYCEDEEAGMELNVVSCYSDSGNFGLVGDRETKWLGKDELDTVEWEPIFAPIIDELKKKLKKSKFTLSVDYKDGARDMLWQGSCSTVEIDRAFNKAIRDQCDKYDKDKRPCYVRVYDKDNNPIRQETFH
jgi:8-oxo-dGTP diphosphatase